MAYAGSRAPLLSPTDLPPPEWVHQARLVEIDAGQATNLCDLQEQVRAANPAALVSWRLL